jgi:hypothetical protein
MSGTEGLMTTSERRTYVRTYEVWFPGETRAQIIQFGRASVGMFRIPPAMHNESLFVRVATATRPRTVIGIRADG